MATWSQVYDDNDALGEARARVRRLVIGFALVSGVLVSAAPLTTFLSGAHAGTVAVVCGLLLTIAAGIVMIRLAHEHNRLWRIELSIHGAIGYDAAGRRRSLPWSGVERLDVTSEGLTLTGSDEGGARVRLSAPSAMPSYTALAHRAVDYTEAHGRLVCVDGAPIEALDLTALDASLCANEPAA